MSPYNAADKHANTEATNVAQAFEAGKISEKDARWKIAALIQDSDVPLRIARSHMARYASSVSRAQQTVDLGEQLTELLFRKMLGLDSKDNRVVRQTVDLGMFAAGKALSGWMQSFATSAVQSEHRNLTRRSRHVVQYNPIMSNSTPDSPTEDHSLNLDALVVTTENFEDPDNSQRDGFEAALAGYEALAFKTRTVQRIQLSARAVCAGYDMPLPRRMRSNDERARLAAHIAEDPASPARLALTISEGGVPEENDKPFAEALGHYSQADWDRLADADPRIAHTIALAIASPMVSPGSGVTKAFVAAVMGKASGTRYARLAQRAATTWLDHHCEVTGSEYGNGVDPKPDAQLVADRSRFITAATSMLDKECALFGATISEVNRTFVDMLYEVETERAHERALARTAVDHVA